MGVTGMQYSDGRTMVWMKDDDAMMRLRVMRMRMMAMMMGVPSHFAQGVSRTLLGCYGYLMRSTYSN